MADNRDLRVRAFLYIENEGVALGLFNHSKNSPGVSPLPGAGEFDETGFVSLERCGHRINQSCEIIERYDVT